MTGRIRTNLRFTFPNGAPLSHGKAQLMELIRETGSIRQAAQRMDMSYRRGWLLADELNHLFTRLSSPPNMAANPAAAQC